MTEPPATPSPRYDALDGARATAMLLGVLYHTLPAPLGMGGGPGRAAGPFAFLNRGHPTLLNGWLHSFRMPLFFLISGFFSHMVFRKYGPAGYLARRGRRIGGTLVVAVLAIAALHQWVLPWGGPGEGTPPPLARFDADHDGSLTGDEWKQAFMKVRIKAGLGGPGEVGRPFHIAERLFGPAAPLLHLRQLWFLWYVLAFTVVAPPVAWVAGHCLRAVETEPGSADLASLAALRHGLAPLAVALASVPALWVAGFHDWTFGQSTAIESLFPDVIFQYQRDWPFQFVYFLAGWWLYRGRAALPDLARTWLPCFLAGAAAYAAAAVVFDRFAPRHDLPHYELVRIGGYALYALATACTSFGFLGVFERYFNRPTRLGRYFADTALWIYIVHIELIPPVMGSSPHWPLPWWGAGLLGTAAVTALACLLFELVVRPTPLYFLFGPGRRSRPAPASEREGPSASPAN